MPYPSREQFKHFIILIVFFCGCLFVSPEVKAASESTDTQDKPSRKGFFSFFSGKGAKSTSQEDERNLSDLQQLARKYRRDGIQQQHAGNLEEAKAFYQKAIVADPMYAITYNDLGVICELQGQPDEAEVYYQKSIQVSPGYLSAYSNLASLSESQRDLKKAAVYWEKRAQLGDPSDPWTERASRRLDDIYLATGKKTNIAKERQVMEFIREQSEKKTEIKEDDLAAANLYFQKAKMYYKRGDLAAARREAFNAMQLDPTNKDVIDFIEKVQTRLLLR